MEISIPLTFGVLCTALISNTANIGLWFLILSVSEAVVALVLWFFGKNSIVSGSLVRAGGTFNDPNSLYLTLLIALPLCVTYLEGAPKQFKSLFLAMLVIISTAVIAAGSRAGAVGLSGSLLCYIWLTRDKYKKWIPVSIIIFAVNLAVFSLRVRDPISKISTSRSNVSRTKSWRIASQMYHDHELMGVGPGNYNIKYPAYGKLGVMTDPKNMLLLMLCEYGIVGGIAYVGFIAVVCKVSISDRCLDTVRFTSISAALFAVGWVDCWALFPGRTCGTFFFGALAGSVCLYIRDAPRYSNLTFCGRYLARRKEMS
ncbi:O-antigen ligase family protein [Capsulimonas corticalis]|uniref:O-antigen ligase family protein n=1 Tax=Capsulimonas corticalis TaxID=2219043 RepID=UPI001402CEA3|nr:O-antigen ligase family protein [Capsulimonas corticalis]